MKVKTYIILGLVGLTTLSFLALISPIASADSVITTTIINVPESCTMSGTGMTSHNATIINGTYSGTDYSNGIGTTTVKVFCNDSAGFAIYAIGYTNDEYGNNKLHWSEAASTSDTTHDINTAIYNSSTTTDSTWSMKLSALSGTYTATIDDGVAAHNNSTDDFTNWHEVPDEYTRVAYRLAGTDLNTDNNGIGSSITTTYDAYISQTQPAGTYTGQVKYTLVHPSTENAPVETINQLVYMQEFNTLSSENRAKVLASMVVDQQYQLKDSRDNKDYYIAKLRDGNVWMTQNLDLEIDTSGNTTYNSTNTDLPTGTTWLPNSSTTSFYNPGELYWNGVINSDDHEINSNDEEKISNYTTNIGNKHYHLGNYYTFETAIAMNLNDWSDIYEEDNILYHDDGFISVEQSICPAGWTLPRGGTGEDSIYAMLREYDSNAPDNTFTWTTDYLFKDTPTYLIPSGRLLYWNESESYFALGLSGDWLSSVSNSMPWYTLVYYGDWLDVSTYPDTSGKASVRCVARPVTTDYVLPPTG